MKYEEIITARQQFDGDSGFDPKWMPDKIFPFQRTLVEWACRKGRAALFEGVGLGKSIQQLTFAENVVRMTNRPVLLLTPLAVGSQMVAEAEKFGVDAARSKDGSHDGAARVIVSNYQRLHLFNPGQFSGIVCDESSILKNADGQTRTAIIQFSAKMRYRLLATATPSPNDLIELGNSSEALGYLGFQDMIGKFFKKNDLKGRQTRSQENRGGTWRFRGHAENEFWRWVCSWARAVRKPSDIGFSDTGYALPPLDTRQHIVTAKSRPSEFLFDMPAVGLKEQRDERRRTIYERCEMVAELVNNTGAPFVSWCALNPESEELARMIPDAEEITGSQSDDEKEEILTAFSSGQIRGIVSKARICGFGLNWQHCAHQTFFPSHSYEEFHQAVGRSRRFGQKKRVRIDIVTSEGEADVLANLERKAAQAEDMFAALCRLMNDSQSVTIDRTHNNNINLPSWLNA